MKIAYLLLAHDNPSHLLKLTEAVQNSGNHCFVHVDAKSAIAPFETVLAQPNVAPVDDRVAVQWGDFPSSEPLWLSSDSRTAMIGSSTITSC